MGLIAGTAARETEHSSERLPGYWTAACGFLIATIVFCLAVDTIFDRNFSRNVADGAAYLDISSEVAHGNPGALLNPYWSPGYPMVLYLGLALLHPSPAWELAAVYAIDCAIAIFALGWFLYFVSGLPDPEEASGTFGLNRPMLAAAGCALFLIAVQTDAPVYQLTPDLLLGAWLWMAAGALLRIVRHRRIRHYTLLAVALSLAYFTKAVALSLVVLVLPILLFLGDRRQKAVRGALLYLGMAALMISPYVAKLSAAKGRFTFGESGSLNYAWIVDGSDRWDLQNDSPHGHARIALVHPVRRLMQSPEVYEFATPVRGSFPRFNDPSYWDDGLKSAFYLKGELWHIAMDLYHTASWLGRRGEFLVALLLLFAVQLGSGTRARLRAILPVLLCFLALWGLYVLVDVEDRYVFAILTSILVLGAAAVRVPDSVSMRRIVAVCTIVLVCGTAIRFLQIAGDKAFYGVRQRFVGPVRVNAVGPYDSPYWQSARALTSRLSVHPNDQVACLELACEDVYWARLAGVRITADIPRSAEYWAASREQRAKAMAALAAIGVKAIVTRHLDPGAESEGWVPLGGAQSIGGAQLYGKLTSAE